MEITFRHMSSMDLAPDTGFRETMAQMYPEVLEMSGNELYDIFWNRSECTETFVGHKENGEIVVVGWFTKVNQYSKETPITIVGENVTGLTIESINEMHEWLRGYIRDYVLK